MNITALLIVSSVSGVSALIWELKDRRDNGKRLLGSRALSGNLYR